MNLLDPQFEAQIEALHEAIKTLPEYQQKQDLDEAMRAFVAIFGDLQIAFEKFHDTIRELWEQIVEVVNIVVDEISIFFTRCQRLFLVYKMKEKYPFISDKFLAWVIEIIPDKWLQKVWALI